MMQVIQEVMQVLTIMMQVMQVILPGPALCIFQNSILEMISVLSQQTFKYLTHQIS